MLSHRHEEENEDTPLLPAHQEEDNHAEDLAKALEELGPCFIKLGQLLSTRPDVLPADYIAALSRLQNTVTPVPYSVDEKGLRYSPPEAHLALCSTIVPVL